MQRITRLDGLRGVLAVYVMLGHALPFVPAPAWLEVLFHHGEAAVDLFFCLSGLVVIQSLERFDFCAWPFLRSRARRLLPVYFLVLAFTVGLVLTGSPVPRMTWVKAGSAAANFWALGLPPKFFWHLLAHVTLTHGLIPQGALPWAYVSILGPAWSLSTEWQFYVAAAALRLRNLAVLALLLLAVAVVYRLLPLPAYWQFSKAFLPDAAGYFALGVASVSVLRGEGWRLFGVVFAGVCLLGVWSGEPWKVLTPVIWGAVLSQTTWALTHPPRHREAAKRPRQSIFLSRRRGKTDCFVAEPAPAPKPGRLAMTGLAGAVLDWRGVQWLGAISYPLYLVNEPVQRGCAMLVAPLAHGDAAVFAVVWLPLAVAAPLAAAAWVHRFVERPMLVKKLLVVKTVEAG